MNKEPQFVITVFRLTQHMKRHKCQKIADDVLQAKAYLFALGAKPFLSSRHQLISMVNPTIKRPRFCRGYGFSLCIKETADFSNEELINHAQIIREAYGLKVHLCFSIVEPLENNTNGVEML